MSWEFSRPSVCSMARVVSAGTCACWADVGGADAAAITEEIRSMKRPSERHLLPGRIWVGLQDTIRYLLLKREGQRGMSAVTDGQCCRGR